MSHRSMLPSASVCVTCLIRPSVGFAGGQADEQAGCRVEVPAARPCGQPAYNCGNFAEADDRRLRGLRLRRRLVRLLRRPSAYPALLADDANGPRALAFSERVHELISFLVDVRAMTTVDATFDGRVTYHDSCSGLRELGVKQQPASCCAPSRGSSWSRWRTTRCAAASAAPLPSNSSTSPTPWSRRKCNIAAAVPAMLLAGDLG